MEWAVNGRILFNNLRDYQNFVRAESVEYNAVPAACWLL